MREQSLRRSGRWARRLASLIVSPLGAAVPCLHAVCTKAHLQVCELSGRQDLLVIGAVVMAAHKGFCPNIARRLLNRRCAIARLRLEPFHKKV